MLDRKTSSTINYMFRGLHVSKQAWAVQNYNMTEVLREKMIYMLLLRLKVAFHGKISINNGFECR